MAISPVQSLRDRFLKPKNGAIHVVNQVAWKHRSPPRYFGWTRSQILDFGMRTNARACATISFAFVPFLVFWLYRYQTVLKPQKLAYEKQVQEELLAEGSFQKS